MERIAEIPDTAGAIFRKSNTLFIDEGDLGTLDDETTRQTFVDKIFELQSMFKFKFDQQANIDEIDNLMSTYKEWEEKKVEKK